jgi:hypothetical protein
MAAKLAEATIAAVECQNVLTFAGEAEGAPAGGGAV